jgi:LysM repeat protein
VARPRRDAGWTRIAAPVAFLVAVTIAVLLVRSGMRSNGTTETLPSTQPTATATRASPVGSHGSKRKPTLFYTVQTGDTFGSIASKYGISVTQLEALNPGVSSNALAVGQKIRVK